ncbi:hypothetical protein [Daejeonella sp.]|uniref:hypothetical protein n=1 Tax=Daejeonella sp. TaxID=2805397 RepID=UPI0039830568
MRTIILLLFVFVSFTSFAQNSDVKVISEELKYTAADSIVVDASNSTIHLYGKADFKYGKVHFVADEIFINRKTKRVIANGLIAYSVPEVRGNVNSNHKILTYTMGENAVFIP